MSVTKPFELRFPKITGTGTFIDRGKIFNIVDNIFVGNKIFKETNEDSTALTSDKSLKESLEQSLVEIADKGVEINNFSEVLEFLVKHPYIVAALLKAIDIIQNTFDEPGITLELQDDPEDGSTTLMAYVFPEEPYEDAFEKIEYVWEEVFEKVDDKTEIYFWITVAPRTFRKNTHK